MCSPTTIIIICFILHIVICVSLPLRVYVFPSLVPKAAFDATFQARYLFPSSVSPQSPFLVFRIPPFLLALCGVFLDLVGVQAQVDLQAGLLNFPPAQSISANL